MTLQLQKTFLCHDASSWVKNAIVENCEVVSFGAFVLTINDAGYISVNNFWGADCAILVANTVTIKKMRDLARLAKKGRKI